MSMHIDTDELEQSMISLCNEWSNGRDVKEALTGQVQAAARVFLVILSFVYNALAAGGALMDDKETWMKKILDEESKHVDANLRIEIRVPNRPIN